MVPELGFGNDFVGSEEADGEYFGAGVFVSGYFPSQNKILPRLHLKRRVGGILSSFEGEFNH